MLPLEIIAIVGISLYFITNLVAVAVVFSELTTRTEKILISLLGLFIALPIMIITTIFEDGIRRYNDAKTLVKNTSIDWKSIRKMERKLVENDLEFLDKEGRKYVLGGELKKEIGLTLNKHLTNRYERGMF